MSWSESVLISGCEKVGVDGSDSDSDLNYSLFYRTIPPLTYKHIENSLTKKGGNGV